MTRGQWIAIILLGFLVLLAIAIGVVLWMRRRNVIVIDTTPAGVNLINPINTVGSKKVNNVKQVKRPASTGATYREVLGKRS